MFRVDIDLLHEGPDDKRYYEARVELPFAPYDGLTLTLCGCCYPGITLKGVVWCHAEGKFAASASDKTTSREIYEAMARHYPDIGFRESEHQ